MPEQSTGLSLWTIYDRPADQPEKFVVRRWLSTAAGLAEARESYLADSLEEARAKIPDGLINLQRHAHDDPCIVETWV